LNNQQNTTHKNSGQSADQRLVTIIGKHSSYRQWPATTIH